MLKATAATMTMTAAAAAVGVGADRRHRQSFAALILLASGAASTAWGAEVLSVDSSAAEIPAYEIVDFGIDIEADFNNPYDPDEIDVTVRVETPSGDAADFPAFWHAPLVRSLDEGSEVWTPAGDPGWRARYAPMEPGEHIFRVTARDIDGEDVFNDVVVDALPPARAGFARRHPDNPRYIAVDGQGTLVALGVNIDWATEPSGTWAYDAYLDDLAAGGGNWTRLWMTHYGVGWSLEWNGNHPSGEYAGLESYNQAAAARLDHLLDYARERGIFVQLVLHHHSQFETLAWTSWADNPYNAANGGPCATSADYFTDPEAQRLAANLHRYAVARWHAYPSLFAWELWNEADLIVGVPPSVMTPWAQDAAADIRSMDPAAHLVTTSFGSPIAFPGFDLDTWDFNNRHMYAYGSWLIPLFTEPYFDAGSPLLLSELGVDWQGTAHLRDTLGVNMHNGVWSAVMNGYAGGGMYWWWDSYVDPNDLWAVNAPMKTFLSGVDIAAFTQSADIRAVAGSRALEAWALVAPDGETTEWIAWIHDRASGWLGPMEEIAPVKGGVAELPGVAIEPGDTASAELFDTWAGAWLGEIALTPGDGGAAIALPDFERDIALWVTIAKAAGDDDADDDTADDDVSDDDAADDDVSDDDAADDDTAPSDDDAQSDAETDRGDDDDDGGSCDGCGC
ncbi:cellulase family glycosylhydrolase [bacterium]|nr:cellulase family glycosylhydrolase [bacterium]